jgi:hypothetical protein
MSNKQPPTNWKKLTIIVFIFLFTITATFIFAQEKDSDSDGITDENEINIYLTDPYSQDTDQDGYNDKTEIDNWYSPLVAGKKMKNVDTDKDDLDDEFELKLGTGINDPDSDDDGYWDGLEVARGYSPLDANSTKVKKIIKVNIAEQKLAYYFGDVKLDEFLISGGLSHMPTPLGNFKILDKMGNKTYGGAGYSFYYPNTKWNLHFTTTKWRYYIHGAYWHNDFGKPKSSGCVNVAYENMERLYYWTEVGTEVEIF